MLFQRRLPYFIVIINGDCIIIIINTLTLIDIIIILKHMLKEWKPEGSFYTKQNRFHIIKFEKRLSYEGKPIFSTVVD